MQNILIVVPSSPSGPTSALAETLRSAGYGVVRRVLDDGDADAVETLCALFAGRPPDLLVCDLSAARDCLPLRHLRALLRQTWGDDFRLPPILSLMNAAHLTQQDWPAYTDDFLLAPYAPSELTARVTLLLFQQRHVRTDETLHFADVVVDLATGAARAHGDTEVLPLTPREYDLLRFLVTHRGKFFARDRLLDLVWGVGFEGGERTVDIHVRRLRVKLPPGVAGRLETRRGIGYGLRTGD